MMVGAMYFCFCSLSILISPAVGSAHCHKGMPEELASLLDILMILHTAIETCQRR